MIIITLFTTDVVESSEEVGSQPQQSDVNKEQDSESEEVESQIVVPEKVVVTPVPVKEVPKTPSVVVADSGKLIPQKLLAPVPVKEGVKTKSGSVGQLEELENLAGLSGKYSL